MVSEEQDREETILSVVERGRPEPNTQVAGDNKGITRQIVRQGNTVSLRATPHINTSYTLQGRLTAPDA